MVLISLALLRENPPQAGIGLVFFRPTVYRNDLFIQGMRESGPMEVVFAGDDYVNSIGVFHTGEYT